ncbi:30S ribosomal protein S9 [Patescibacteria group bacterium]|nr:30S ribosomal protein S9 [Patescibacteria group bacterium]
MIKKTAKKIIIKKKSPKKTTKKVILINKEVKTISAKKEIEATFIKSRYIETVGRRKTSVARVRFFIDGSDIKINGKDYKDYLKEPKLQGIILAPLVLLELENKYGFTIVVFGGGINSQAEAIRHGISRALIKFNEEFKKRLKKCGFVIRDPRMVERKKPGLRKARRAPQWSKR